MSFSIGKELRTLGVVEFVVLIIDVVFSGCNYESSYEGDGFNLIGETIHFIYSLFKLSLFISILVFLNRDIKICNNTVSEIPIYLASSIIAFTLIFKLLSLPCIRIQVRAQQIEELEEEEEQQYRIQKKPPSLMKKIISKIRLPFTKENSNEEESRDNFFLFIPMFVLGLLFIIICFGGVALGVYFVVTSIKIAIPGEYEALCTSQDTTAKAIMLGLPICIASIYVLSSLYTMTVLFGLKIQFLFAQLFTLVALLVSIVVVVLWIILSIRMGKVWRGEEFNIYEFVALTVAVPLLSSLL